MIKNLILISFGAIYLVGCSGPKAFINLPENVKKDISSTDTYLLEPSKKVNADVEVSQISTYTGGGLLIGLIDGVITSNRIEKASDAAAKIQIHHDHVDLKTKLEEKISTSLKKMPWIHANQLQFTKSLDCNAIKDVLKKSKSDCVLFSNFDYKLTPNFDTLVGTLYIELYSTGKKKLGTINKEEPSETPIFKFNVSVSEKLPEPQECMEINSTAWAHTEGQYLKNALNNIIKKIIDQFECALQNPSNVEAKK